MTREIKRRKKYCYEGWIKMAEAYYFKDEKKWKLSH